MLRMILGGFWICLVTLATGYFAIEHLAAKSSGEAEETNYFRGIAYEKTRSITVPIIVGGAVDGYVVAQFVYTAETRKLRDLGVPPESFIVDEAYNLIFSSPQFSSPQVDFRNLRAFDTKSFLAEIAARVNKRLEAAVIRDMLIEEFNFVDKSQLR
jgi:hypothetical protein